MAGRACLDLDLGTGDDERDPPPIHDETRKRMSAANNEHTAHKGFVLVTGSSTGIGRATARLLARLGFFVFAAVRKDADSESWRAEGQDRIEPVILDVTRPETISATMTHIETRVGNAGLFGLVNNAGIGLGGPVEFLPMDDLRRQFEVNFFGLVAVTQAAMPLIRRARGRVVHVSSASGLVSQPFAGPYCASKFALEAMADAMRMELRSAGIQVSIVEPGRIKTPIWDRTLAEADRLRANMSPKAEEYYGAELDQITSIVKKAEASGIPAEHVAEAILHALSSPFPRIRYLVGMDARIQVLAAKLLPTRAFDALAMFLMKKGWV
ncbi:MAG: SDR family oxidoreductase [Deltaproteobacteria bacterium]|nr:SDR family oxidoreductase [Deltaproteobacteria bacterium]